MSESKPSIREIFNEALEIPDAASRAEYLAAACGQDGGLRQKIEGLLEANRAAGGFLDGATHAEHAHDALSRPLTSVEGVGDRIGRYKLREQIGEGGCGTVYVAEQEEPIRRRVALKVIKLGMDTRSVVARFEAERQALAMMDHPNIARVLDAGTTETGGPFFVMELVPGIKITDYCDQNRLPLRERLELFIKVCQAVQHAHQKGIVHRDLKPSNVLVTLHDGVPVPKVIDFGIAKAIEGRLTDKTIYTELHQFIGTPAYMSPEQAEMSGLDIDTRSDIYSLGVLLYELLTSIPPFETRALIEAGFDEMRRMIRHQEPLRPSTRLRTVPDGQRTMSAQRRSSEAPSLVHQLEGDLDWIVMKCLEKDRKRRYDTANGLAADLGRFLRHEPVTAASPSAGYLVRKFVRRNRTPVIVSATIAVVLLVGATASTWLAMAATRARDAATHANELLRRQVAQTEQARRATDETLQRMRIQKAEDLFEARQASLGIAYLAQVLRANPSNPVASARLVSALVHLRFPSPLTEPLRHEDLVVDAHFSPDGSRVITRTANNATRIWDARTGLPLTESLRDEDKFNSGQFSPDGQWLLTASGDGTARVWDARTGQSLTDPLRHDNRVLSAAFSPDGRRVATASSDRTARVWDARTGQPLTEPLSHEHALNDAQFSPDGCHLVTASDDRTARVWDEGTVETPVPQWFADWAEALAGRRFNPRGMDVVVEPLEQRQQWDQATRRTGGDFFTRIAHWVQADLSVRTISPFSAITISEYVNHRLEENTLASLHEAIQLSPIHAEAFIRLAWLMKDLDPRLRPTCLEEAEFYAHHALQYNPGASEAWRAMAAIQLLQGRRSDALRSVGRALELRPESSLAWETKGEILEQNHPPAEALAAYDRQIELLPLAPPSPAGEGTRAGLHRAHALRQLGCWQEAIEANQLACGIPAREGRASTNLVDLSAFYNAGLKGNWHGDETDSDLSDLPTGVRTLAGVPFDVRGLLQLASGTHGPNRFPDRVDGLPGVRQCRRIHFLQGAIWGMGDASGTVIGKYVLHCSDGEVRERPIVLGQDTLDWFLAPPEGTGRQGLEVAWSGSNAKSRAEGRTIQLYQITWENPRPDHDIISLDFVSARQVAGPFLVAITGE